MVGASTLDHVVLVDDDGTVVGSHERATVHQDSTPLHLGFSCYLFDRNGHVLLTRRALSKRTFPGVWTNSFCGHPRPAETLAQAVLRHAQHELGVAVADVEVVLPDFRYQAWDEEGTMENELCPVLTAITHQEVTPHPEEVCEWRWIDPDHLAALTRTAEVALSPWAMLQIPLLRSAGTLTFGQALGAQP